MKLAVIAEALDTDPRAAAQMARGMGLAGVMFSAYAPALSIPELSQSGRREFRHMLGAQELELVGLRGDVGAKGFGPGADIDRLIDRIDRVMEAAAGLAAPLLCLELGPLAEPPREIKPKPAITPEQAGMIILPDLPSVSEPTTQSAQSSVDNTLMSAVNAALTEIGLRADRYSVTVAFSSALASFHALEHAITAVRCPWFGVDLDPVAILRDEWEIDEIFSRLGPLVRHTRTRDALAGSDRRTKPAIIGHGSVQWPELIGHLDESGYAGWLTIDPSELTDRVQATSQAISFLRPLVS